jgi:hypothetical protein
LGILAGDVGILGIEENAHLTAGIREDGGTEFRAVGEVDEKRAAGVGAVVDAEGVHGAGRRGWGEDALERGGVGMQVGVCGGGGLLKFAWEFDGFRIAFGVGFKG